MRPITTLNEINDGRRRTGSEMIANSSTTGDVQHTRRIVRHFYSTHDCRFSRFERSDTWHQAAVLTGCMWYIIHVEQCCPRQGFCHLGFALTLYTNALLAVAYCETSILNFLVEIVTHT